MIILFSRDGNVKYFSYCVVAVICSVVFTSGVRAQEKKKELFPENYSTTHMKDSKVISEAKRKPVSEKESFQASEKVKEEGVFGEKKPLFQERDSTESSPGGNGEDFQGEAIDVYFVSAIVSGTDELHLKDSIEQIEELVKIHKIPVKDTWVVGEGLVVTKHLQKLYSIQYTPDSLEVLTRNGMLAQFLIGKSLRIEKEIPPEYAMVDTSPTWIIGTKQGTVILEAVGRPLSAYFNKKGQFVDRQTSVFE